MSAVIGELTQRYQLLHGADTEAARAEIARIKAAGKPVVIVSACLLGVRCRYDGGDKRDDAAVSRAVPADAEILPLCPEVLARLGVPRPAITLSADNKFATDARGRDVTPEFEAGMRLADLFAHEAGAVSALLKERSPSCGVTEIHGVDGLRPGEGHFTTRLRRRGLPIVSEKSG
ncbi:MAG: Purine nucleoside phosphorylase [Myxococcales bacterium]|nr:Purine nucleoside phosphorylase [Myxococcales bacterium]